MQTGFKANAFTGLRVLQQKSIHTITQTQQVQILMMPQLSVARESKRAKLAVLSGGKAGHTLSSRASVVSLGSCGCLWVYACSTERSTELSSE